MINASFAHGDAAITGLYQYDTGQRVRLHGLPSPKELAEQDTFLSGDSVTVQVQYGYVGDSQTETRLASYDDAAGVWLSDIPDTYLTRSTPVHVYVYVGYGAEAEAARAKTCYEATFTPIGRPAPSNRVTPAQTNAWDVLVAEINLTLASMLTATSETNAATEVSAQATTTANAAAAAANTAAIAANSAAATTNTATGNANTATNSANIAASNANTAASSANAAADAANAATHNANATTQKFAQMSVTATTRDYGSGSTASLSDNGTQKVLALGLERGPQGVKGDKGDTGATGPAGVSFALSGTTLYITLG